jgi:hypothetical protein
MTAISDDYYDYKKCKMQLEKAHKEAYMLAMFLWDKFYKDESPDFQPLDTAAGIITQIDNMLSGLKMERDA